jgi:hypothetical protein
MMIHMARLSRLLFLLLMTEGKAAFACAVCGTAIEASRKAFIFSTAILSLAPLIMIGGLIYYVFRANRRKQDISQSLPPSPSDKLLKTEDEAESKD